jgi:hypothetical protein
MSQSKRGLSRDRATSSAPGPQSRHFIFQSCRPLIGCHRLGGRLQQLNSQVIGALALVLEICSIVGCRCFEPRDLRHQCHDLCHGGGDVVCLATTSWAGRIPQFGEINAHQGVAIIRTRARQPASSGKRTSGLSRDFEAGT